jgi:hypothetical protein
MAYYTDTEDEAIFLAMLEDMDYPTAENIYTKIREEAPSTTSVSNEARNKPFKDLTYRNLRYIILGCKNCGAELRVKALATFIVRASTDEQLNVLVSNDHLKKILFNNLQQQITEIYKWSGLKYEEANP